MGSGTQRLSVAVHCSLLLAVAMGRTVGAEPLDLLDLSLEQLSEVEITSVSRHAERLSDAAASVFVLTHADIRRSGAASLPEALRLAPNLLVARISASTWAISARGFNNSLGNKLLVLIDGRTVYTPLFSGVFWDAQDVMLEDVERIEVISGPGATLWGANAVNGVINVITRSSADTQGGLVAVEAGSERRSAAARYGGALGSGSYRAYARRVELDATVDAQGVAQPDAWTREQGGVRADFGDPSRGFTVQSDAYRAESELRPFGPVESSGAHLLAAWNRRTRSGGSLRVQAYYDHTERDDPVLFHDRMDIFDVEFQHAIPFERHRLVWGGGYRRAEDEVRKGFLTTFIPGKKDLHWENLFVQDEYRLQEALTLTAGVKLDRNVYTGTEVLPSLRAAWKPNDRALLWGSASRAVRAPSRIDREFFLPAEPPFLIAGGPDFHSEISDVYELGWRAQAGASFSYSLTAFQHEHDDLRSGEPQSNGSFQVQNGTAGRVRGVEGWASWQPTGAWRLSLGMLELRQAFHTKFGSHDPDGPVDLGNDPRHQWSLRSTAALTPQLDFSVAARYVGDLPEPAIPSYVAVDAGLEWRLGEDVDVLLSLRNLFDDGHVEFQPGPLVQASVYERSAAVKLLWRW
jgi:iron complex outermembrane receptor protein